MTATEIIDEQEIQERESVRALVTAAQAGDRDAFGQLVERYQRTVYATAYRRLNDHAEAQELTQEVFVQAMRKLSQLRDVDSFVGWLRSITRRMAINRAVRRHGDVSVEPETLASECVETHTPLESALVAEERARVRAGLKRLRKLDRQTLVAFYIQGQSLAEMCVVFDSPVGTIKRRLHVARKRLADELAESVEL